MKALKQLLCTFLSVALLLCIVPAVPAQAASGTCGDNGGSNVLWTLEGDTLTIYGSGKMESWVNQGAAFHAPWAYKNGYFTTCIIKSGVTSIGNQAFFTCDKISKLYIPKSVTKLGSGLFMGSAGAKYLDVYYEGSAEDWKKLVGLTEGYDRSEVIFERSMKTVTIHYNSYHPESSGSGGSSSAPAAAGWQKDSKGWWYSNGDGSYAKNQWKQIGGKWYFFDSSGYMKTGWISSGSKWYFCDSSGAMKTGWLNTGGKWYYLDSSGAMKTGWQKIGGVWYYLDSSGVMKTGWQKIGGKWYFMNKSGVMQTGWKKIAGKWYYMDNSGVMQAGKWVGDYYLTSNGSMAVSRWIGKYYVGADGKWVRGAVKK